MNRFPWAFQRLMCWAFFLGAGSLLNIACDRARTDSRPSAEVEAQLRREGHWSPAKLSDGVEYLGWVATPGGAHPGDVVRFRHFWRRRPGKFPKGQRIFVHGLVEGATGYLPPADHDAATDPSSWETGQIHITQHDWAMPAAMPGPRVFLRVGMYAGDRRVPVEPSMDDGHRRIKAGQYLLGGVTWARPQYQVVHLATPPQVDGNFKEAAWGGAHWHEGLTQSHGRQPARRKTRFAMGWHGGDLFVAFDLEDPDILATMRKRDAPVYKEESFEIFLDAGADGDTYAEFQVNPLGAMFDAAFAGGPRRGMNRQFSVEMTSAVRVEGSVASLKSQTSDQDVDRRWYGEWRIPMAAVARQTDGVWPPSFDQPWRFNVFRVGKDRIAGRLTPDESALSPPAQGDFHNLERMGDLWFVAPGAVSEH